MNKKQRRIMRLQASSLRRTFDYQTGKIGVSKWVRKINKTWYGQSDTVDAIVRQNEWWWLAMTKMEHARDGQLAKLFRDIKRNNFHDMSVKKYVEKDKSHFVRSHALAEVVSWDMTMNIIARHSGIPLVQPQPRRVLVHVPV